MLCNVNPLYFSAKATAGKQAYSQALRELKSSVARLLCSFWYRTLQLYDYLKLPDFPISEMHK